MPECYTHSYIATQALMRSGYTTASKPAFIAGANGPDPLFLFEPWKKQMHPDLPGLADRMHREKTGEFLCDMLTRAVTPVQQSFVLGYLTHYTTDCTLYPFIEAVGSLRQKYSGVKGKRRLEATLDSMLYYKDYRTYEVSIHAGTPVLITDELAQVTGILHETIKQVYEITIPRLALADMYHDNLRVRRLLTGKSGFRRLVVAMMELSSGGGFHRDYSTQLQPAPLLEAMPESWENPYTKEKVNVTFDELLILAEQTGAACIKAAMKYWLGEIEDNALVELFGNNVYYTGLPADKEKQDADCDATMPKE